MRIDSKEKALEVSAYATDHDDGAIRDLIHRGFDIYREGQTDEEAAQELLNDIDYFFSRRRTPMCETTVSKTRR